MKPKKKSNVITIDANQAVKHPMQCAKCFRVCRLSDSGKTWVCTICKHREKANGGQAVSDTPRTDDQECDMFVGVSTFTPSDIQQAFDFARQLERELNAANAKIKRLEEAGDMMALHAQLGGIPLDHIGWVNAWHEAKEAKL